MSSQELWQWVHSSYGNELGLTSSDDDYVSPRQSIGDKDGMAEDYSQTSKVIDFSIFICLPDEKMLDFSIFKALVGDKIDWYKNF